MAEPSEALGDLALFALDHAIESVRDGGPLVPFVISAVGPERSLQRFLAETLETSLAHTQSAVGALGQDVTAYAVAHDGYLTVEGEKFDAVLVEAGERGSPDAVLFAQRYRPKKALRKFTTVGNPAIVGDAPSRL